MISEIELKSIEEVINGEDEPNICWFVDVINSLIAEIRKNRGEINGSS